MNYNYKLGFVILHYQAMNETINCIESIKKNMSKYEFEIIVVDNNSPNKTGKLLKEKYKKDSRIYCIINEENLGFAKGNNIGFQYAKNNLNCDFICCLNNDTILLQPDFFSEIIKEYPKSQFAVLGPFILLNNNHIQKIYPKLKSIDFYKKELDRWKKTKGLSMFEDNRSNFRKILSKIKKIILKLYKNSKLIFMFNQHLNIGDFKRKENIVLHDCCLIFSPRFIALFEGFNEKTFMFREEELLYLMVQRSGLKTVYNPKIKIKHLEDAATNQVYTNDQQKFIFYRENQINSLQVLLKELNGGSI